MPDPNEYDNENDFMAACVPMRMGEGDDNDQAVAVCLNMWRDKKSFDIQGRQWAIERAWGLNS